MHARFTPFVVSHKTSWHEPFVSYVHTRLFTPFQSTISTVYRTRVIKNKRQ